MTGRRLLADVFMLYLEFRRYLDLFNNVPTEYAANAFSSK